ncbi:MAG: hypothetical protein LW627_00465 [Ilumatobacteraceae bacterium]|nr:hypothetical protein [Ilumatobacteraceae bacterium]
MKISKMTRFGAVVAAFATIGAACGGDGDEGGSSGPEKKQYAEALAVALAAESDFPFDEKETLCIAERVVDVMGVQMFVDAGVSAEDVTAAADFDFPELTEEQTAGLTEIFLDGECIDMGALMADMMMEQSAGALTEDQAACIGDGLAASESFAEVFASGVAGDESADPGTVMESEILQLIVDCDIPLDAFG